MRSGLIVVFAALLAGTGIGVWGLQHYKQSVYTLEDLGRGLGYYVEANGSFPPSQEAFVDSPFVEKLQGGDIRIVAPDKSSIPGKPYGRPIANLDKYQIPWGEDLTKLHIDEKDRAVRDPNGYEIQLVGQGSSTEMLRRISRELLAVWQDTHGEKIAANKPIPATTTQPATDTVAQAPAKPAAPAEKPAPGEGFEIRDKQGNVVGQARKLKPEEIPGAQQLRFTDRLTRYGERDPASARERIEALEGYVQKDPTNFGVLLSLGIEYNKVGRYEDALAILDQAAQINPRYAQLQYERGVAHNNLKQWPKARAALTDAAELDPNNALIQYEIGIVETAEGDVRAAEAAYAKAVTIAPNFDDAQVNLGNLLARRGDYKEAAEHYEAALQVNPERFEALFNLGQTYRLLGQFDKALDALERTQKLQPDYAPAKQQAAEVRRLIEQRRYLEEQAARGTSSAPAAP